MIDYCEGHLKVKGQGQMLNFLNFWHRIKIITSI